MKIGAFKQQIQPELNKLLSKVYHEVVFLQNYRHLS